MNAFFEHLEDPAPGFRCRLPSSSSDVLEHTVLVRHELGEPAEPAKLAELEVLVPDPSGQLRVVYEKHDGMLLYVAGATAGVRFYPVDQLEARNEEWKEWFDLADEEDLYPFQSGGAAFAEVDGSGNYFVLWEGQVYYSDHEGPGDEPLATSLSEFLDAIASDPARFLERMGLYTRYGDEQWIPREYVRDLRA